MWVRFLMVTGWSTACPVTAALAAFGVVESTDWWSCMETFEQQYKG